ncbi:hypothetical protein ACFRI7_38990 [Streptomyces sp. NPDC056716]|uniref:hypothetical protein n=1 Tax=Streptomyces sp. NPDC056716 TaxID=3345922 RepID=UPI0036AC04FF
MELFVIMAMEGVVVQSPYVDRSDGRFVLVEATGAGLEVFRLRRAERAESLRHLIEELSEREQHAVQVGLPALALAIQARPSHCACR